MRSACQSRFEREVRAEGFCAVAGVDEVGRGALFGPVFAAAVILSPDRPIRGLRDSKELVRARREILDKRIRERAVAWATAAADAIEIDRINIYQASRLAMKRAVEKLAPACDFLLVDALKLDVSIPQRSIIHGDALSQCIAAASIVAKVHRDRCMQEWDRIFPQYGLARNKGYSAPEHLKALQEFGPAPLHRFSFEPVRANSPFEFWSGYEQMDLFAEDPAEAAVAEAAW